MPMWPGLPTTRSGKSRQSSSAHIDRKRLVMTMKLAVVSSTPPACVTLRGHAHQLCTLLVG